MNTNATKFLPMTRREMQERGWEQLDILLVSGDAYVDHPAFGLAVIGRTLEAAGYRVGIISQPDWTNPKAFQTLGAPKLFIGVTAGAMDSMVANYTANRLPRSDDAYTPGGESGRRPNNATIVYTSMLRGLFKGVPVVLGGIEASLRRFAHYDYWRDKVRRSVLLDSKADLIVAGMGEKPILEIADRLKNEQPLDAIPGTVQWKSVKDDLPDGTVATLPAFESIEANPERLLEAVQVLEESLAPTSEGRPAAIAQRHADRWVIEYPAEAMTTEELDRVYALPYQRKAHPTYRQPVPALDPVRFSITSHRGCFGGCSFCALAMHQGKHITPRSPESIIDEIKQLADDPDFKGTISDVGGPTANMYGMAGKDPETCAKCKRPSCLFPDVCHNLNTSHEKLIELWNRVLELPGVKHAFVASGIRHDLIQADPEAGAAFMKMLAQRLVGGQLSAAPEHGVDNVLLKMRKPPAAKFERFVQEFQKAAADAGRELYIIPYLIAGFPGSTTEDAQHSRAWLERLGCPSRQIQDFLPGPMTLASAMFHTKIDPATGQAIEVPSKASERREQREALLATPRRPSRPSSRGDDRRSSGNRRDDRRPSRGHRRDDRRPSGDRRQSSENRRPSGRPAGRFSTDNRRPGNRPTGRPSSDNRRPDSRPDYRRPSSRPNDSQSGNSPRPDNRPNNRRPDGNRRPNTTGGSKPYSSSRRPDDRKPSGNRPFSSKRRDKNKGNK